MNNATWAMLNETEKALLREVEPHNMADLDEDGLSDLHDRIRRARRKYTKLYRRRASAQVVEDASRTKAHAQHARTVAKAEAFEDALATVSQALARAARASAKELKAERLAAARANRGDGRETEARGSSGKVGPSERKVQRSTPISKKGAATSRATTRRAEAKRDSR